MRIIAGTDGGRTLRVPPGRNTRPTSDRVKEAVFSRLEHLGLLAGARVLDLFAGSGALGLEAASRGAAHVLLVDKHPAAVAACRDNVAALTCGGVVAVRQGAVATLLATPPGEPYDLVLADPPYDLPGPELDAVLQALLDNRWLAPDGLLVLEGGGHGSTPRFPTGLVPGPARRYGDTRVWFAEVA